MQFVCSTCKVSLLNYEALGQQLFKIRLEILETHKRTAKLYEAGAGDSTQAHCANENQTETEQLPVEEETDLLIEQCYDEIDERSEHSDLIETCFEDTELIDQRSDQSLLDTDLIEQCAQDVDFIEPGGDYFDLFEECSDPDDYVDDDLAISGTFAGVGNCHSK